MALPSRASHSPARLLWHYICRHPGSHALILSAVLAAVGCAIGSQYGIKTLVDALGRGRSAGAALWWAVAFLLALVAGDNLLWRLAGWVAARAFVSVGGDLRLDLFEHLSGHGARYFSDHFPGALAGRITTAADTLLTIENSLAWTTIPPAAAVISSIAILGLVNWRLSATLLVIVTGLGALIGRLAARSHPLHDRFAGRASAVTGDIADIIGNIGLVHAFAAARHEQNRLADGLADEMAAHRESLLALERLRLFHAATVLLVTVGVLVWSVGLWQAGRITVGDVVLATTLGFTVLHASRDLAMALVSVVQQFARLGEAVRVIGRPHEMIEGSEARPLIRLGGSVSFLNVCFGYPEGSRVLRDFSLHLPAGQKVGLVGRSGAGKSTILSLLQRLYDPERGHVLIDEQDIAGVTRDSLRRAIAVVHQDIQLFHRSLIENLRYGRPEANDREVCRAAAAAHCMDFITRLPQGFETLVGERGLKLSGGQRQRLAIARAFLCDAPIVLLDEATSALDTESEEAIQEALARLFAGRTVIAIAHRLSTLSAFDRIVVLEHGRIIEDGEPSDLLGRESVYGRMYARQRAGVGRAKS